ncbi:MAG: C25 family cysteine peptidase [Planctomycetota bacterium]|nr:C25 family cysteine peptidase [Planctomycetota bacterium]
MLRRLPFAAAILIALAPALPAQSPSTGTHREAFLVPMPRETGWRDLAFLAAIPAASVITGGKPVVLALESDAALSPESRDFLARYRPERITWIGGGPDDALVAGFASARIAASTADEAACAIADRDFGTCAQVVVARADDYASALSASVLAARLRVPLYFCDGASLSPAARASIERRGAKKLLLVGDQGRMAVAQASVERLRDAIDVARWMKKHDLPVDYLAAAAPVDRVAGHVRKLSLAAAVLAAGRSGAVAPVGTADAPPADPASVRTSLARVHAALGGAPEFLCIAASPEAIPMAVVPCGAGVDTDPPSDRGYADVDDDPFLELAFGRFVAESGAAGTLLAARSLAYDDVVAPASSGHFAMAEWERLAAPSFADLGFAPPSLHVGPKTIEPGSPLTSVGVLIHSAHSSWLQIGDTYAHDSAVLLAPCVVESAGCSPAALDQDAEHRSVALRLLRNGAVAFVGNVRRGVAQQELYRSEFWNAVLAGESLGRAHRSAQNRMLVAVLANGESEHGLRLYQLYNAAFYGDPALVVHLPGPRQTRPARVEVEGRDCVVRAPAAWWRTEAFAPADWNYTASAVLYGWRGGGVGVESSWDAEHKRNREELVYTAEVRTRRRVGGLVAVQPPGGPPRWDGRHFVDEHADGTRSVYFRVRMIDGDPATGEILRRAEDLRFRLE